MPISPVKQTSVLRLLEAEGPLTIRQIIEKTGTESAKYSVRNMCHRHHFIQPEGDARAPAYALTDAGRAELSMRKIENPVARVIKEMKAIKPAPGRRTAGADTPGLSRHAGHSVRHAVAVTTPDTKITIAATIHRPPYEGAELRAFDGRPGAMRAYGLPSRGIGA